MELKFDSVTKRYRQKLALDSFSVTLTEGVHALLGPNGAGKSTLMNILAGLLAQTSGSISLDGRDIIAMGADYRAMLGFMPQEPGFYKSFSAFETLDYYAVLRDVKDRRERIDEMLCLVNLQEDAKRRVGSFSGGMKRRLGIALALLNDPKILILDEPTAGLDPKERIRFRNLISQIGLGKTVILATHIVSDIESISDSVLLLKDGRLIGRDTADGLCRQLEGMVWDIPMSAQEAERYIAENRCANIVKHGGEVFVHTLSQVRPAEKALLAKPCLEDVYMHSFGDSSEARDAAG
ncbi:MAG: ABC transporter ATP-binding protein [Ruminococcus sp.]|nr:ABC transporter ATP-binding protein [Ruminococcus sp.]